nr:SPOR domain-containing protein [Paenibacillus caui]
MYENGPVYETDTAGRDFRLDVEERFNRAEPLWTDEPINYRPPSRSSGWKVFGSVTGAVVTGALFGLVVLSLFNKEVEFPIPGLSEIRQSAERAVDALPVTGEASEDASDAPAVQLSLPEQSYYFLQYGVFSTPERVEQAQQELQDSGLAAAKDTLNDNRVYAGISPDREQAKLLSGQLKAEGVNLILHEAVIPTTAVVRYSNASDSLEAYAELSAELVKLLSETSASLLLEESPAADPDLLASLKEKHVSFTQSAAAIRSGFTVSDSQLVQSMETEMNSAVEALQQFGKTKAKSHLWEVQNSIMRYILDEQQLFREN